MKIIIILICVSLSIALGFLLLFLWSVRSGQYEDMYTPSVRMLFDEKKRTPAASKDSIGSPEHCIDQQPDSRSTQSVNIEDKSP